MFGFSLNGEKDSMAIFRPPATGGELAGLFACHGRDFIAQAYRLLLQRDPDPGGLANYCRRLNAGELCREEIVAALCRSPEGRRVGAGRSGCGRFLVLAAVCRLPLIGGFVRDYLNLRGLLRRICDCDAENSRWWDEARRREHRLQELERRCAELENEVTVLALRNSSLAKQGQVQAELNRDLSSRCAALEERGRNLDSRSAFLADELRELKLHCQGLESRCTGLEIRHERLARKCGVAGPNPGV